MVYISFNSQPSPKNCLDSKLQNPVGWLAVYFSHHWNCYIAFNVILEVLLLVFLCPFFFCFTISYVYFWNGSRKLEVALLCHRSTCWCWCHVFSWPSHVVRILPALFPSPAHRRSQVPISTTGWPERLRLDWNHRSSPWETSANYFALRVYWWLINETGTK